MRERKKRLPAFMSLLTLVLTASTLIFTFQNCAPLEADFNPLYDTDMGIGCVGVSCERDLNAVNFQSSVSGVMIDMRTGASNAANCDSTTCFDVGGFCDTGGYPGSVFFYQWLLGGSAALNEVRTSAFCDENGRFQVLVKVPFASFDWNQTHRVRLYMKVIDEEGVELTNPTGTAEWTYVISVRTP